MKQVTIQNLLLRKRLFNKIMAGTQKVVNRGQWSGRKAQMLAKAV